MQRIKPIGLNLRKTDYEIEDGFLQECINLQWRDNALRPIPNRIETNINTAGSEGVIMHKIGDENTVNVLAFATVTGNLEWIGTITDGVYTAKLLPYTISGVNKTSGMSYVILNGLIYFMGDGSSATERYYLQVKYLESNNTYQVKDLYSWKNDIVKFNTSNGNMRYQMSSPSDNSWDLTVTNGVILIRYALVLDTGEVVMHSPIYPHAMKGFFHVADLGSPNITTLINNHTCVDVSLDASVNISSPNVASVKVYATIPYYENEYESANYDGTYNNHVKYLKNNILINKINELLDTPFYLIDTIDVNKLSDDNRLYLYAGKSDTIEIEGFTYGTINDDNHIDINTIAAGEVMPVDNFSWHKLFGRITSDNGRLIISQPTTVLTEKIWDYNALIDISTNVGAKTAFTIDTEDGLIKSSPYSSGKAPVSVVGTNIISCKTILGYPDYRTTRIIFNGYDTSLSAIRPTGSSYYALDFIKKIGQNLSCNLANIDSFQRYDIPVIDSFFEANTALRYHLDIKYLHADTETRVGGSIPGYTSNNRIQFTQAGEFSTFPVENSYRIGEGTIMAVGSNSIIPNETFVVAPLIIGTSDGVYSLNLDQSGANLVSSITRIANLPYISRETLQIGNALIAVTDKGLIGIENGGITNLTEKFFPDYGNGNYPAGEDVYPNYDLLTVDFFGSGGNDIEMIDIVQYMKGAIFAFDSRRDNLWCCNNDLNFSLIYNLTEGLWTMSKIMFTERIEFYSLYNSGDDEIYSRYMILNDSFTKLLLLSGEDSTSLVKYHLLTRPVKLNSPDDYKKINRFYARCELYDNQANQGYFVCGLWGKQDTNKTKPGIALAAVRGTEASGSMPYGVRQDIPVGRLSGKYKTVTVLLGGNSSPESSINGFDFNATLIPNNINK